jgi:hypothetical protein
MLADPGLRCPSLTTTVNEAWYRRLYVYEAIKMGVFERYLKPDTKSRESSSDVPETRLSFVRIGRYWIRTSDPHYVKVMRYQLRQPP